MAFYGNHWRTRNKNTRADRAGIGFPIGQTVEEVEILERYAKSTPKHSIIVEIGTRNGGTALVLAMNSFSEVHTIDIEEDPRLTHMDMPDGTKEKIYDRVLPLPKHWARYPGGSRIHFHCSVSWEFDFNRLPDKPIGLCFIDGSHEYDDCKKDWNHFYPKVMPGGICILHDFGIFPGVTQFVEEDLLHEGIDPIDQAGSILIYRKPDEQNKESST